MWWTGLHSIVWVGLRGRNLIRLWAVPILLAVVALAFDATDRRFASSVLASGALDEPAHLATGALGLLALSCLIDVPPRFYSCFRVSRWLRGLVRLSDGREDGGVRGLPVTA
jgi:hypothetical protein